MYSPNTLLRRFRALHTMVLACAILIMTMSLSAQSEADLWYFGNQCGLDFSSGTPVAIAPSSISTTEGCATVSDATGNLRFYTDGITVWDATHATMSNGTGLTGSPSSTQSGVAIPDPGDPQKYYLFTAAAMTAAGGISYSTIDMTLNGGLGEVTSKNNVLLTPACEKITAVNHANGRDIWVLAHDWNSADFYAWLVTPTGIDPPIVTTVGTVHAGGANGTIGYMKTNARGDRIALAIDHTLKIVEIFDFDNVTGVLSNPLTLSGFGGIGPYGIEFSPNGNLLYVSEEGGDLLQFDLSPGTGPGIQATRTTLAVGSGNSFGAIQIATNGIIYVVKINVGSLDAILEPDMVGVACNYQAANASLGTGTGRLGLPNFITSFFNPVSFTATGLCEGEIFEFEADAIGYDSVHWDFGDPTSGSDNTDTGFTATHRYTTAGSYNVVMTVFGDGGLMVLDSMEVDVYPIPVFALGPEAAICPGAQLTLSPGRTADTYLWSDGSMGTDNTIVGPGLYWLEIDQDGCIYRDTIEINASPFPPQPDLGPDRDICAGQFTMLTAETGDFERIWEDQSHEVSRVITTSGTYTLTYENECGSFTDDLVVNVETCCDLFRPTAITPNNDKNNNSFELTSSCDLLDFNLKIFNRWGQVIFETTDQNDFWTPDGDVTMGVYVYHISYVDPMFMEARELRGNVTLLR